MKLLFQLAIPLLVVLIYLALVGNLYLVGDVFYLQWTTESIAGTGAVPEIDSTVEPPRAHVYPPLYDVLTTSLGHFGGSFSATLLILPFFFTAAYFLVSLLIARIYLADKRWQLTAALIFTIPLVALHLGLIHFAQSLGVLLFLFSMYALLRYSSEGGKSCLILLFIFLAFLPLAHLRSALVTYAVVFAFGVLRTLLDWKSARSRLILLLLAAAAFLPSLPWVLSHSSSFSVSEVANPFLEDSATSALSISLLLLLPIIAAIALLERKRIRPHLSEPKNQLLLLWLLIPLLISLASLLMGKSTFTREFAYIALPLSLLVCGLSYRAWKKGSLYKIFPIVIIPLLFVVYAYEPLKLIAEPFYTQDELAALLTLRAQPEGVVMSHFNYQYAVPVVAEKKVIVGAFAESLPDAGQRLRDIMVFFITCDADARNEILAKYNVTYVFIDHAASAMMRCPEYFDSFDAIYASGSIWALKVRPTQ